MLIEYVCDTKRIGAPAVPVRFRDLADVDPEARGRS